MLSDTSCTLSTIRAILVPFHGIFTATIYRDISWPWRYWYRRVGIDDKYRGIVGIAQHYCKLISSFVMFAVLDMRIDGCETFYFLMA